MKIIKEGENKKREDLIYRHSCNNCGTVFEFTRGESRMIVDPYDGEVREMRCPTCNKPGYENLKDAINY